MLALERRTGVVYNHIYLSIYPHSFSSNSLEVIDGSSDIKFQCFCPPTFEVVKL